jgi:cytochrome c oxidase cbb3-type subunit 4
MDISDLHSLSTVLMMIAFIGICWWAFAPKRKKRFDDAANLPFADEDNHNTTQPMQTSAGEHGASEASINEKRD